MTKIRSHLAGRVSTMRWPVQAGGMGSDVVLAYAVEASDLRV
jgi:hypothetical protein